MTNEESLERIKSAENWLKGLNESGAGLDRIKTLVSPEKYNIMKSTIEMAPEPETAKMVEDKFIRGAYIKALFPRLSVNQADARANEMTSALVPSMVPRTRWTKYLGDAWDGGRISAHIADLLEAYPPGSAGYEEARGTVEKLRKKRASLADNAAPNAAVGALGTVVFNSLAFMADEAVKSGISTIAASTLAGALTGSAAPGLGTAGGAAAGLITGAAQVLPSLISAFNLRKRYAGMALDTMEESGLDIGRPETRLYAAAAGSLMSAVDMISGVVPLEGGLTRALFGQASKNYFNGRAYVKTAAAKTFRREVIETLPKALFQGVNETAQDAASNYMIELAALEQDRRYKSVDWDAINANKAGIKDSLAGGIIMELTLGIPAAFLKTAFSVPLANKTARIIQEAFEASPNAPAAVKLLEKTGVFDLIEKDGLSETARRYYEANPRKLDEEAALKNALRPTEAYPADMRYKRDGALNLVFDRPQADGADTGSVRLYDPYEKSAPMGVLEYRVDDDGIYIDRLEAGRFKNGANYITNHEKVVNDMLYSLRSDYGGLPVVWEPDAAEYKNVKDGVLENVNSAPIEAERSIKQTLEELLGIKNKVEYVENEKNLPPSVQAEINKQRKEGFEVPGLMFKREDGRFTVYMDGKKQTPLTLPHELLHVFVMSAAPEMKDRLSKAMGLADSSESAWTAESFTSRTGRKINAHEKLAEYWEDYLSKRRRNIPSEIKALFDRLAGAVKRMFDALGWKAEEAPAEVRAVFDEITSGKFASRTGEEARGEAQTGNRINEEANARLLYALKKGERPTKEQTAEAKRQYEEVENLYKDTGAWLKAPNGADTKLNTRQWIQVRTPLFKKYFGDWERLAAKEMLEGPPVTKLLGDEFKPDGGKLSDKVLAFYKSRGETAVTNPHIGEILVDERAIHSDIGHGIRREKAIAFAALPEVLRKGRLLNVETVVEHKNLVGYMFGAPIEIKGDPYIMAALVRNDKTTQRLYVHEVALRSDVQASAFKTEALTAKNDALNGANAGTIKKIIQDIYSVKPSDVSAVRDAETGEPLVVWHGTKKNGFSIFIQGNIAEITAEDNQGRFFPPIKIMRIYTGKI
jgi:hypothetical protein